MSSEFICHIQNKTLYDTLFQEENMVINERINRKKIRILNYRETSKSTKFKLSKIKIENIKCNFNGERENS